MKARFRKPLAMFLVVMMFFTLMPAGMVFGDTAQPIPATVTGNTQLTGNVGIDFSSGFYSLQTTGSAVDFDYPEGRSSVNGDLPNGISLGYNTRGSGVYLAGTPQETTNGTVTVTINVVATDKNDNGKTYTGSIAVKINIGDTPADIKLDNLIADTKCEVSMTTANTEEGVLAWIKNTWLPSLTGYNELAEQLEAEGKTITVTATENHDKGNAKFQAAVAGTASDPDGTDGYLYVSIDLMQNNDPYYYNPKECTILATQYSSGGGTSVSSSSSSTPSVVDPDKWEYFTFNNNPSDFFANGENKNYSMGDFDKDFEKALKKLYPNNWVGTLSNVEARELSTWGGSCYGYAAVELLANLDKLDIIDYYWLTNSLPKVEAPADTNDKDVRSLLNYYYLTQFVPAMRSMQHNDGLNSGIMDMAEDVVNGERYMFTYFFSTRNIDVIESGHAIVLDGGEKHADGSYTLKGYDNRYHKYFWADDNDDPRKVEGEQVFLDVVIDKNGNCIVKSPTGNITMKGDTVNTYSFSGSSNEYVVKFETLKADASSAMMKRYEAFIPEGEKVTFIPGGDVVYFYTSKVYNNQPDNVKEATYYIAGATNTPTVSGNQVKVQAVDADDSAAMMSMLDQADDITIANPEGRLALVDGNYISAATVTKADSVTLSTNTGTAEIKGNNGTFTMQVTAQSGSQDYVVYTVTGSGKGNIKAVAAADGVDIAKDGTIQTSVTSKTYTSDLRIVMQINNQNIVVNNKTITNDVPPVIVDDRTLVPVRIVTELLGGSADWNADTRTVTLTIDGKVLKLVIGEEIAGYGTGAAIMDNRTYVPIRYVAEQLGAEVEWIADTRQIVIEK